MVDLLADRIIFYIFHHIKTLEYLLSYINERGQGHFSCSADHVQDWQPYPVDPYSCYMCDHRYWY